MVTLKQNISDILIQTCFIRRVEDLDAYDKQDLAKNNEPLLLDHFANENYFAADLHEGGIAVLAHDDDKENDNDDGNTGEIQ